jgi:hypothetical protein
MSMKVGGMKSQARRNVRDGASAPHGDGQVAPVRLGAVVALALPDAVWVALDGGATRLRARVAMDCDAERLQRAILNKDQVVLAFEDGDLNRPLLLGIVAAPRASTSDSHSTPNGINAYAEVDGERVQLRAQQEIVLQCGDASISLRRDGRVTIRGAYIETNARTTNRIKGGNVRIN